MKSRLTPLVLVLVAVGAAPARAERIRLGTFELKGTISSFEQPHVPVAFTSNPALRAEHTVRSTFALRGDRLTIRTGALRQTYLVTSDTMQAGQGALRMRTLLFRSPAPGTRLAEANRKNLAAIGALQAPALVTGATGEGALVVHHDGQAWLNVAARVEGFVPNDGYAPVPLSKNVILLQTGTRATTARSSNH